MQSTAGCSPCWCDLGSLQVLHSQVLAQHGGAQGGGAGLLGRAAQCRRQLLLGGVSCLPGKDAHDLPRARQFAFRWRCRAVQAQAKVVDMVRQSLCCLCWAALAACLGDMRVTCRLGQLVLKSTHSLCATWTCPPPALNYLNMAAPGTQDVSALHVSCLLV